MQSRIALFASEVYIGVFSHFLQDVLHIISKTIVGSDHQWSHFFLIELP